MPDEDWRACAGDVRLRAEDPVYACVRIAHDHRTAAVAAAQRQGERVVVSDAHVRRTRGRVRAGRRDRAPPP